MKSYSAQSTFVAFLKETRCLYSSHRESAEDRVTVHIRTLRNVEELVRSSYQVQLKGMQILDIGVGQFPFQLIFFSQKNHVLGIDFDVIPFGFSPLAYFQMLWFNGFRRTLKTLGRKLLRVDSHYKREIVQQLGLKRLPNLRILHMDACRRNHLISFIPDRFFTT